MFRRHKTFAKLAFFAVITVKLLIMTQAKEISQCDSVAEGFIENNDSICKTKYPWVYCNGASSTYCTAAVCQEEFECKSEEKPAQNTPAPTQPVTPTPSAPAHLISQCDSVAEGFIENNDPICKTKYPWVYCNGASSTYCTAAVCQEEFECKSEEKPAPIAPAPTQPVTSTPNTQFEMTTTISSTTLRTAIIRENCKVNKKLIEPYPGSCRYYYQCVNGYFGIGDCGRYMFFDSIAKKCTNRKPRSCL